MGFLSTLLQEDESTKEEHVDSTKLNPRRRSILQGIAAAAATGVASGAAGASQKGLTDSEWQDALKGSFMQRLENAESTKTSISESDDDLSNKQKEIVGEAMREHAGNLIQKLDNMNIFDGAEIDADSLTDGSAFTGSVWDVESEERGLILFHPEPNGGVEHTKIQFRVGPLIDDSNALSGQDLSIEVIPEFGEAYAVGLSSPSGPTSDTGSSSSARTLIKSDDVSVEQFPSDVEPPSPSPDGVILQYCKMAYNSDSPYCVLQEVRCIGCECSESTIGNCTSGSDCVIDKKCQTVGTDPPIEQDPCHQYC